jgi:hypothetical protein
MKFATREAVFELAGSKERQEKRVGKPLVLGWMLEFSARGAKPSRGAKHIQTNNTDSKAFAMEQTGAAAGPGLRRNGAPFRRRPVDDWVRWRLVHDSHPH